MCVKTTFAKRTKVFLASVTDANECLDLHGIT